MAFIYICFICFRHKRKVQQFLPCKNSPQNNCDGTPAAGVIYEDLTDVLPRTTPTHNAQGHIVAPSIEVSAIIEQKIRLKVA